MFFISLALILFTVYTNLSKIDSKIHQLTVKAQIFTEQRQKMFSYSNIPIDQKLDSPTIIGIDYQRKQYFWQNLQKLHDTQTKAKSFLFHLKNELYIAQCFDSETIIYNKQKKQIVRIGEGIDHYSILKYTTESSIGLLSKGFEVFIYYSNFTLKSNIRLKTQLNAHSIKFFHLNKQQNKVFIYLFLSNGKIYTFDQAGTEKSISNTQYNNIVTVIQHLPNPIIVGDHGISSFQLNKLSQIQLGCPIFETNILDAISQSPFSMVFYILTNNQIILLSYSYKRNQKECKILNRLSIEEGMSNKTHIFYPLILKNNSFVNISQGRLKQSLIPLNLCKQNTYSSSYKNNQNYLLHICCTDGVCLHSLYLKVKKQLSESKYYKFGIFFIILIAIIIKVFSKQQYSEKRQEDLRLQDQQNLNQIIKEFSKNNKQDKKKSTKSQKKKSE